MIIGQIDNRQHGERTSHILTPEQLATFWAIHYTGHAPTPEQMERAKARRERRGVSFLPQTQLELDLLAVMAEDGRRSVNRSNRRRGKRMLHCNSTNRILCVKSI